MMMVLTPCLMTPRKHGRHCLYLRRPLIGIPIEHPRKLLPLSPSTPVPPDEGAPSIPETPRLNPDHGGTPPEERAIGVTTGIDAKDGVTQTPPLLPKLIQGHLDHTGIEACFKHQMDHGVRDPQCDHCKRALGPLYHDKLRAAVTCQSSLKL